MLNGEDRRQIVRSRLEQALGVPFTEANSVRPLRNGDEIFPAMLDAIAHARGTIEFLTFIYWSGDIADRFARALSERASHGVEVRVLLDSFGAIHMPGRLVRDMRKAGVEIRWFRPLLTTKVWTWNKRTHRKVLVCDGEVAFTGGVGIATEWEGDARNPSEWRDTHFRFTGPSVDGLRSAFWSNWLEAGGRIPTQLLDDACHGRRSRNASARKDNQVEDAAVEIIRSTASIGWNDAATVLRVLIDSAERRLAISTGYFSPDRLSTSRLVAAVKRGVDVSVVFPGPHTDRRIPQLASARQIRMLLKAGVQLWRFQPTMLHTKIVLVDDAVACVGSANFNQRSLCKDEEVCAVVVDAVIVEQLSRHLGEDLERSKPLTADTFLARGAVRRVKEAAASLLKSET